MVKKYIVIFKIPFVVDSAESEIEAFIDASRMTEAVYGFRPSPLSADIVKLDSNNDIIDSKFFNPTIQYKNYE